MTEEGMGAQESLAYATAVSAANALRQDTGDVDKADVANLICGIKIVRL